MKIPFRKQTISCALAIAISLTAIHSPSALAENLEPVNAETCVASGDGEPVQIPYYAITDANELIAHSAAEPDVIEALEGVDVNYEIVGPQPMALPAVAAIAVAAVAWCVKGAFTSLPASGIQQMASMAHDGIAPPTWVMNAIFGCAGGPVLGALTSQAMRVNFAAVVLATVIKLRNFG